MRLLLIVSFAMLAAFPARADPPLSAVPPAVAPHGQTLDLSSAGSFSGQRQSAGDTGSVLPRSEESAFENGTASFGPVVNFGPVHARLGSMESDRGRGRLAGVEFDTSDFLGSHLAAGLGSRSARFAFTVPVP